MQESTSHAWCTQVQEDSNELEDFKIVIGDNTQVQNMPAAAPEERAAGDVQVQKAPGVATQGKFAALTCRYRMRLVQHSMLHLHPPTIFRPRKRLTHCLLGTRQYDSTASRHVVSEESFISKHVVEKTDCSVRIKGSCGTSIATKKGTLIFGIQNTQDQVILVALEVVLVPDLGASIFSVGAQAEKGVKCNLLSTPPVLLHGTNVFPIETEVPRMYVVNIMLDDVNLDGPQTQQEIFCTKVDAHMWHRRIGHCNPRALQ